MLILIQQNNGSFHELNEKSMSLRAAKKRANVLHNPDWPCWVSIGVYNTISGKWEYDTKSN